MQAEAARDTGQIRPNRAAFIDKPMAGGTGHGAVKLPAALKVAPALKPGLHFREEFIELPFVNERPSCQSFPRRLPLGMRLENRFEGGFFILAQVLNRILFGV